MLRRPVHAAALLALITGCGAHDPLVVETGEDLAARIAAAPDRATVRIGAGRFHLGEAEIRGKSLNIIGAGRDATFLESTREGGLHFSSSLYSALQDLTVTAVAIEQGQLTLVGVRVDGGSVAISAQRGSRLILRTSEVTGAHAIGVRLASGAAGTLENSLVDGGVTGKGIGMEIPAGARASVLNTVFRRHARALSISAEADVEIHGNLIEETPVSGIEDEAARWRIDDNVVWVEGAEPGRATRERVCANLPNLRYGAVSRFHGVFCHKRPSVD